MRIAFVTETFLPKVDGIVNTLCHLLRYLAERNHASLLIAPAGGPRHFAATPVWGVPGWQFPLYRELRLAPPVDMHRPLSQFRPDVVHSLNPVSLGLAGLWWARWNRVPAVASYHTDVPGFAQRWGWGWAAPGLWAFFRAVHNAFDLNLAPSRFTRAELHGRGFKHVKVWGRGVDTHQFGPHQRTAAWRDRLTGGAPDKPLLLYVGRLSPEKRADWLRPVIDHLPHARLAIVGDGPQRADLERLLAGTPTVFTGYLTGHDLAQAYAAADVFVFPAANETLGNVVLEALASGLPVVAPRAGGVLDHVRPGHTGLLFDPESIQSLVQLTALLVHNTSLRAYMAESARRYALSRTWPDTFDGLLGQYTALIHRRQRAERRARLHGLGWAWAPMGRTDHPC